jgi:dipeptidyl-peptidase-3
VSPESETIFDLILEIARYCDGNWNLLSKTTGVSEESVQRFLDYSAAVLDSVGNYRVRIHSVKCVIHTENIGIW